MCGLFENYDECRITPSFECTINNLNVQCDELPEAECAVGLAVTVVWRVYNPECDIKVTTKCSGFPGCFGEEEYPSCYSTEVYATYSITECGVSDFLTFEANGQLEAIGICTYRKTYCNNFRISSESIVSTMTTDDTCINPGDGCNTV